MVPWREMRHVKCPRHSGATHVNGVKCPSNVNAGVSVAPSSRPVWQWGGVKCEMALTQTTLHPKRVKAVVRVPPRHQGGATTWRRVA